MAKGIRQYRVKLNSNEKVEELLQEIYLEACKNIEEAQREINKISMSTDLNQEIIDGKAKYAKAINDFIATKDKAIARKMEIAKLMTEVVKYNGNLNKAVTDGDIPSNWDDILASAPDLPPTDNKPVEYFMK